jgi:transcriptional regulator with XRE-family HTH domain
MSRLREQVGIAVRLQRKARTLSRADLADAIGRSSSMITRIERGEVGVSLETLEKLATGLGVEVRDLFPGPDQGGGSVANEPLENLVRRVSNLAPDDLKWVDELVRVALARKVRERVQP